MRSQLILIISSFLCGCITTAIMIRYGIGLGTRIVYRTKEDLPAFGKIDDEPIEQSHVGGLGYDEVENEREI